MAMAPWQREYPIAIINCCVYTLHLFKKDILLQVSERIIPIETQ